MKVFLSWSGDTSHQIAEKLYGWLPMVIQKLQPYISTDIEKGSRWSSDIAGELENCTFGIACVTHENRDAPWLLFEAGALSKSVSEGRLAPLLCGIEQADIQKSPLTQFQMTKFEKREFLKLLRSMNETLEDGKLEDRVLENLFEALWPKLESDVEHIIASTANLPTSPNQSTSTDKVLGAIEELLTNSRSISQIISRPDRLIPEDYMLHILNLERQRGSRSNRMEEARHVEYMLREAFDLMVSLPVADSDKVAIVGRRVSSIIEKAIFVLRETNRGVRVRTRPPSPQVAQEGTQDDDTGPQPAA